MLKFEKLVTKHNDDKHWQECDCGYKTEEVTHTFETDYDSENHWKKCACGQTKDVTPHDFKVNEINADYHILGCHDCEYVSGELEHTYEEDSQITCDTCSHDRDKATLAEVKYANLNEVVVEYKLAGSADWATGAINPIPETGSEAEWNNAINFWQAQNNVRVEEWIVTPNSYDLDHFGTGAQIMLYQYNGKAHSEDGYEELNPTGYKGKAQYHVDNEDGTYSYIYWGYMDSKECWVENPEISKSEYEATIASTIYSFTDLEGRYIVFNYANFSYDSTNNIYKYNANNNITVAFEFTNSNLTKLVVKRYREDDHVTFTSTITFGNADIKVPVIGSDE